jgi:chemotaxis protein MotA
MMHVLTGVLGFAAILFATVTMQHANGGFAGFLYKPAMLLVGVGPLFIALISHTFGELFECIGEMARALRFSAAASRAALREDLVRFGTELRRGRPAEALVNAESSPHELMRMLAPLTVKQYSAGDLERTASTASYVKISAMKRHEDVLTGLARVAPATGLVGTTLGLIALLKDLHNFEQLGPSMALALLCTLYGLVLANGLYQPIARLIHVRAVAAQEEARLVTRALVLVGEGKPLADVRALFGETSTEAAAAADLAVG